MTPLNNISEEEDSPKRRMRYRITITAILCFVVLTVGILVGIVLFTIYEIFFRETGVPVIALIFLSVLYVVLFIGFYDVLTQKGWFDVKDTDV